MVTCKSKQNIELVTVVVSAGDDIGALDVVENGEEVVAKVSAVVAVIAACMMLFARSGIRVSVVIVEVIRRVVVIISCGNYTYIVNIRKYTNNKTVILITIPNFYYTSAPGCTFRR